jgi:hypothetical protein
VHGATHHHINIDLAPSKEKMLSVAVTRAPWRGAAKDVREHVELDGQSFAAMPLLMHHQSTKQQKLLRMSCKEMK